MFIFQIKQNVLFTQPDENHGEEGYCPGPVHAGGEGGVAEVIRAVAELLKHVLTLVRLALHVQHGPLGRTPPRHPHSYKCCEYMFVIVQSMYLPFSYLVKHVL